MTTYVHSNIAYGKQNKSETEQSTFKPFLMHLQMFLIWVYRRGTLTWALVVSCFPPSLFILACDVPIDRLTMSSTVMIMWLSRDSELGYKPVFVSQYILVYCIYIKKDLQETSVKCCLCRKDLIIYNDTSTICVYLVSAAYVENDLKKTWIYF